MAPKSASASSPLSTWFSSIRNALGSQPDPNRRREPRLAMKFPIEIKVPSGVTYPGVTRDLSSEGMGALVSAPLQANDEIIVNYEHPAGERQPAHPVTRRAVVKQRHGYRFGFAFRSPIEV